MGKIGRLRINSKIYKTTTSENKEFIKPEDLLGCLIYLSGIHSTFDF